MDCLQRPSHETIPFRGLSRQVDLEGWKRITDEVRPPNSSAPGMEWSPKRTDGKAGSDLPSVLFGMVSVTITDDVVTKARAYSTPPDGERAEEVNSVS